MTASYNAGIWTANSAAEACEMAREDYRNSMAGRTLNDVGAFRFYTVDKFDHEKDDDD